MSTNRRTMNTFEDILEPRRQEFSNFMWVSRKVDNSLAYRRYSRPRPEMHKHQVMSCLRTQELIDSLSRESGVPRSELEHQVRLVLDEVGYDKKMKLIRWLGFVLTKICNSIYSGIYVNAAGVERLKSAMGTCPVIFAPSHRSYADFILLSYVCFAYEIEIPAIAAGMDFHAMWGMSKVLRNTGAFFMRRSFNDDNLYWETFRQYIHQLVTKGDIPVEFFIEGTRSRSCKSLSPKLGLLSMLLKPLFTAEVPDVLVVPINISYERVLEEKLFAYEHLGVPKPKESTSGFFKALSIVKENFGNVYFDFAEPISLKQLFDKDLERSRHVLGPVHHQQLLPQERVLVSRVAHHVVQTQQRHCTLTLFNLAAVMLNHNLGLRQPTYSLQGLQRDVQWLRSVLEQFGALVSDVPSSLLEALHVHKNLLSVGADSTVSLVKTSVDLSGVDPARLKGHAFSEGCMAEAVPLVMLQLYVNPCLHLLVDRSLVTRCLLSCAPNTCLARDELLEHFQFLRRLFSQEFVFFKERELQEFEAALSHLQVLDVVQRTADGRLMLGGNEKLRVLLNNLLDPFFSAYHCTVYTLLNTPENAPLEHSRVLSEVQKCLEQTMSGEGVFIHPYCLSLDTLGLCMQSLLAMALIERHAEDRKTMYKVRKSDLRLLNNRLGRYSLNHISKLRREVHLDLALNNQSKL